MANGRRAGIFAVPQRGWWTAFALTVLLFAASRVLTQVTSGSIDADANRIAFVEAPRVQNMGATRAELTQVQAALEQYVLHGMPTRASRAEVEAQWQDVPAALAGYTALGPAAEDGNRV